jgi:hypothetical protein
MTKQTENILLLLFLIFLQVSEGYTQNYNVINPERERTYGNRNAEYVFLKIDSTIHEGEDSILYFAKVIDTNATAECDALYKKNSILGSKLIIQADSTHIFFNDANDSIILHPNYPLGQTWRMYTYADGGYIEAKINSYDYLTIMPDVEDSLKGIKLNIYNSSGVVQDDSLLNGKTIDFTKNFGLVQTFRFDNFPFDTTVYYLRGLTSPDTGLVNLTANAIFNFELGYEFHYREKLSSGSDAAHADVEKYYKYFVLQKYQYADSVVYDVSRAEIDYSFNTITGYDTLTYLDTISIPYYYADYAFLDTLEMKLFYNNASGYADMVVSDSAFAYINHKYAYDWFTYIPFTNCLLNESDLQNPQQHYGEGVGTIYYKDSTDQYNFYILELLYFQRGLTEWGNPINFDTLGLVQIENTVENSIDFKMFPNPANDILYIRLPAASQSDVVSKITDTRGNFLQVKQHNPAEVCTLNISDLPAGCYIITITTATHSASRRFIKN